MNHSEKQFSKYVSVPPDEGVRVDKTITIRRPVHEVYTFWRRFENLPRFLHHIQSVTVKDDLHSHWVVKTPEGKYLEWDAEMIEQRPDEMISWRSTPGSDISHAGSVWFTPLPSADATAVRLELQYVPSEGKPGFLVSKILGQDAQAEIGHDLGCLKAFLETGQLPEPETAPAWRAQTAEAASKAANAADIYIREHPWQIISCAALAGFMLGLLLLRRRA